MIDTYLHLNKRVEYCISVRGILLLALVLNLTTGCNNCKTDPILIYASKEVTNIGIFKPGTFWVYQNELTGERDSVIVTDYEYLPDTIRETCKDQQVDVNYEESFFTYSSSFFYSTNYVSWVKVAQPLLVSKENYPADTLYSTASCTDTGYCNVIDTLKVFGVSYLNVFERIDSSSDLYDGRLVHFYSAPNVGLVKREILISDSTWESWGLVNSVIVQ